MTATCSGPLVHMGVWCVHPSQSPIMWTFCPPYFQVKAVGKRCSGSSNSWGCSSPFSPCFKLTSLFSSRVSRISSPLQVCEAPSHVEMAEETSVAEDSSVSVEDVSPMFAWSCLAACCNQGKSNLLCLCAESTFLSKLTFTEKDLSPDLVLTSFLTAPRSML